jgi:putative DNA primase/helicase
VGRVLEKLSSVRANGARQWMARCPAHDDRTASLSVKDGRDGRVLLYCHARCATAAIVAAIGLEMTDLFPAGQASAQPASSASAPTQRTKAMVKSYDYTDESGALLFQVCRFHDAATGAKDFRQRRPDGRGGWIWSLGDVEPVLYRLSDVMSAVESGRPVYIVEGEKDADALAGLGYAATTCPMGAGKWREAFSATFKGAEVVILPDNDDPGRSHAEQVAASLVAAGAGVRVVPLPDLPPKGDVSDWLDAGGSLETLEGLIGQTRLWSPDARHKSVWRLDEILANDELMRPPLPIIPRVVWRGRSTLLSAQYKSGKSTLTGYLAAQVSTGGTFLGDPVASGRVVILALEEALGDIGRRLRHFGAQPDRVYVVSDLPREPSERREALAQLIDRLTPDVVIVDTLVAYGRGLIDNENDAAQMAPLLQELTDLAHKRAVGVVIVHHTGVSGRTRGSTSIPAGTDIVIEVTKPDEKNDPTMRKAVCMGRMPVADFEFRYTGAEYTLANDMGRPLIQRVLDFVRANPSKSHSAIRTAIAGRAELVDEAVNALLQRRFIYDVGDPRQHAYEASTAAPTTVFT